MCLEPRSIPLAPVLPPPLSVMKTIVEVLIYGCGDAWKVAEPSDTSALVQRRRVELEIQGDGKNGYHLVMSPEGCFTADTWHETLEDAKDTAHQIFGVGPGDWR